MTMLQFAAAEILKAKRIFQLKIVESSVVKASGKVILRCLKFNLSFYGKRVLSINLHGTVDTTLYAIMQFRPQSVSLRSSN